MKMLKFNAINLKLIINHGFSFSTFEEVMLFSTITGQKVIILYLHFTLASE